MHPVHVFGQPEIVQVLHLYARIEDTQISNISQVILLLLLERKQVVFVDEGEGSCVI